MNMFVCILANFLTPLPFPCYLTLDILTAVNLVCQYLRYRISKVQLEEERNHSKEGKRMFGEIAYHVISCV
jgi:hypothetical protein